MGGDRVACASVSVVNAKEKGDLGIPSHVAIIMDGNGRWAKERGLLRQDGHRAGAEAVKETVEGARELGIKYITLYAFSSQNWNRPKLEVAGLMGLLERFLKEKLGELEGQGVRLHTIGQIEKLPRGTRTTLQTAKERTKDNDKLHLILALSYGGREEIVQAAKRLGKDIQDGSLQVESINEIVFSSYLDTADFPDPDLLVRTSGEMRLSNFLLWQLSYAEMVVTRKMWPDFKRIDLREAVEQYQKRERRFGLVLEK